MKNRLNKILFKLKMKYLVMILVTLFLMNGKNSFYKSYKFVDDVPSVLEIVGEPSIINEAGKMLVKNSKIFQVTII